MSEDGRISPEALDALLNQIPGTMPVTRDVIVAALADGEGNRGVEKIAKVVTALIEGLVTVENRLERLEGRPGIPAELFKAVMSEFRTS
jgi:hypothetical protein